MPLEKNSAAKIEWLAAALVSVAILWLHFYFLFHAGGLWRDEVNLVNLAARHSLAEMAAGFVPILMPLLISVWSAIGLGSDLNLRLLGTLIGLGIPAALWAAAWTARRSPPLISLALLGLNSVVIFYGDSLRGHGLGTLSIVLAAVAAWSFLKKPTWSRAGILAITAILSVQSLYQNAVLFAAICAGAWTVCCAPEKFFGGGKILVAALVAAASLLPYWKNISGMPAAAVSQRIGFVPAVALHNFNVVAGFPLPFYPRIWEFLTLAVIGSGCAALFARDKKSGAATNEILQDDLPLFAGATLLAAFAGFTGFLWFAALLTQPWYFLPPVALAAVCFELGIPLVRLPRLVHVTAFFALIVATALIATLFAQRDLNRRFTNVDRLARQLAAKAAPQDFIVVTPWYCGISFDRYFKAPTPWQTLPPLADHSTHRYDLFREKMKTPGALQPLLDQIAATLQSGHRVWIVGAMDIPEPGAPPVAELPPPPIQNLPTGRTCLIRRPGLHKPRWFLAGHSLQFERVDHENDNDVSADENMGLLVVQGWTNSIPATNKP